MKDKTKIIIHESLYIDSDTRLFAINKDTGEESPIDDLYWFEKNGVHDFAGDGHSAIYSFRLQRTINLTPQTSATLNPI